MTYLGRDLERSKAERKADEASEVVRSLEAEHARKDRVTPLDKKYLREAMEKRDKAWRVVHDMREGRR